MPFGTDGQALGLITFFDIFQDVKDITIQAIWQWMQNGQTFG